MSRFDDRDKVKAAIKEDFRTTVFTTGYELLEEWDIVDVKVVMMEAFIEIMQDYKRPEVG